MDLKEEVPTIVTTVLEARSPIAYTGRTANYYFLHTEKDRADISTLTKHGHLEILDAVSVTEGEAHTFVDCALTQAYRSLMHKAIKYEGANLTIITKEETKWIQDSEHVRSRNPEQAINTPYVTLDALVCKYTPNNKDNVR